MPGALVLKPTVYAAYLAGYIGTMPEEVLDAHLFDEEAPPERLAHAAAYALGNKDARTADPATPAPARNPLRPRDLREVLPIVRGMIEAEPTDDMARMIEPCTTPALPSRTPKSPCP